MFRRLTLMHSDYHEIARRMGSARECTLIVYRQRLSILNQFQQMWYRWKAFIKYEKIGPLVGTGSCCWVMIWLPEPRPFDELAANLPQTEK